MTGVSKRYDLRLTSFDCPWSVAAVGVLANYQVAMEILVHVSSC